MRAAGVLLLGLVAGPAAAQVSVYWDTNGATAGASGGTTADGIWDQNTTASWSTNSGGTAATGTWQALTAGSGLAIFSAGTNATGASAVTVSGTVTGVRGITFADGTVTLSGGTVALGATSTINTGANDAAIGSVISGTAFGLTKTGTGTLTLTGANTYTGVTTISAGTLVADTLANGGTASSIGQATSVATNLVLNGGTLQYAGAGAASTNRLFSVGATGGTLDSSGAGAVAFTNTGTITMSGTGSRTLTLSGSNTGANSLASIIADASGGGAVTSVTKTGAGSWALSGANTFAGVMEVSAGTLTATTSAGALGAGTLKLSGGTLHLGNDTGLSFGRNTTVSADTHIISDRATSGAGVTYTLGTLSIGAQTLFLDTGSSVTSGTAALTFGTTTFTGNASFNVASGGLLTLGALNDGSVARALTKDGAGMLTLGTAAGSLVNGTTIDINAGTVNSNHATALGSLANVTLSTGATLNLGASQTFGALNGSGGTVSLGASTLTLGSITNNLSGSYGGAITGTGGVTKAGTGTTTLSGANSYSGTTTVSAGMLAAQGASALGTAAGAVTVSSGATLSLAGGTTIAKNATLTLNGAGVSASTGALHGAGSAGESAGWAGNISLAGATTLTSGSGLLTVGEGSTFTHTLSLGANTLTLNTTAAATVTPVYAPFPSYALDASNLVINSKITGTGGLRKTGTGTATIIAGAAGGNTFTGTTNVTGGTLIVDATSGTPGINSSTITIGNAVSPGAADSVVLQMGQAASAPSANNILGTYNPLTNASASSLTVYSDGLFNMNGASNGFISLTLVGGHVSGGDASYSPLLTITSAVATTASSRTALIDNGNVAMSANNFTFTVATGTAPGGVDLQVDSVLQNGVGYTAGSAGTSLNKAGTGLMLLTNANTYSGVTNVTAGVLSIRHANALGQASITIGDTGNGTTVASGAQLQLQGGITVAGETLQLNGTGVSSTGALRNTAGDNFWNGFVNIAGTGATITADTGTSLTIANPNGVNAGIINGTAAGKTITFGGAGDINVNGGLGGNLTTLTKSGTGTLTLAGTNGYTGATSVTGGVLKVTNSNALSGTGVTINTGTALHLAQDATSTDISLVGVAANIRSDGISGTGAIRNLNGDNSYAGAITMAGAARINADGGSSLTLTGNVTNAGFALTAGGAGNTTYSGVIGGTGAFSKDGTGTVTLSGGSANTFSGGVTVNDGTVVLGKTSGNAVASGNITVGDGTGGASTAVLQLSLSNQISNATRVTVAGDGRFDVNGVTETIGSFAGTGTIATGSGTLITGADNTSTTFGGAFAGNGVIQKTGTGTLTFNATLNFAGELNLNGGTLALAGVNFTVGTLRISGNTVLDFGNSAASILTATNLIIENGATLSIVNWVNLQDYFYATNTFYGLNTTTLVQTPVTPNTTGIAPQNQITFTGFSGNQTQWQSYDNQVTPAPEPSTYGACLIGGAVGLLVWRRRRRRTTAGST